LLILLFTVEDKMLQRQKYLFFPSFLETQSITDRNLGFHFFIPEKFPISILFWFFTTHLVSPSGLQ